MKGKKSGGECNKRGVWMANMDTVLVGPAPAHCDNTHSLRSHICAQTKLAGEGKGKAERSGAPRRGREKSP